MSEEPTENGDKRNPDGTFAIGNAGGPGRPVGTVSLTTIIRQKLQEAPPGQMKILAELLAEKVLHKAYVDGNETLIKEIWHYVDGMPSQEVGVNVAKESLPALTAFFKSLAAPTHDDGTGQPSVPSSPQTV